MTTDADAYRIICGVLDDEAIELLQAMGLPLPIKHREDWTPEEHAAMARLMEEYRYR